MIFSFFIWILCGVFHYGIINRADVSPALLLHWSENANTLFARLYFLSLTPWSFSSHLPLLFSHEPLLFFCLLLSFLYQARASIFSQSMNSASFYHCHEFNCCPLREQYHRYCLLPFPVDYILMKTDPRQLSLVM